MSGSVTYIDADGTARAHWDSGPRAGLLRDDELDAADVAPGSADR